MYYTRASLTLLPEGRSLAQNRKKTALVVCGPTAGGKSVLSDALADRLTEAEGLYVPTLAVDSMQVYRELPVLTNQARRRPAALVGIISVTEEWTVARHKALAEEIIASETKFVLDAGTGMYLNAILLDIPLAPKVSTELRPSREARPGRRHRREVEKNYHERPGGGRKTKRHGRGRNEDKPTGDGLRWGARALRAPLGDAPSAAGTGPRFNQDKTARTTPD
jgi:hypothetical protein